MSNLTAIPPTISSRMDYIEGELKCVIVMEATGHSLCVMTHGERIVQLQSYAVNWDFPLMV